MFSNLPDFSGIFYLAAIGIIAVALVVFVGVPWLGYYIYSHIQWVNHG